jgi:hypothetical protein
VREHGRCRGEDGGAQSAKGRGNGISVSHGYIKCLRPEKSNQPELAPCKCSGRDTCSSVVCVQIRAASALYSPLHGQRDALHACDTARSGQNDMYRCAGLKVVQGLPSPVVHLLSRTPEMAEARVLQWH